MPEFSELTSIEIDAENQRIFIKRVDSSNTPVTNYATCSIALADLMVASTGHREAKFRWVYFQDSKDACAAKKMLVLCTEPEADT